MPLDNIPPINLVIVTDAWKPQVNGVVTTLGKTGDTLKAQGHQVNYITPENCKTIPCPTYPEIRLVINPKRHVQRELERISPSHIHIATEGPLGLTARNYCVRNKLAFTTSYHTQFPEYINKRVPVPLGISYRAFHWFHKRAARTMVGTPHQKSLLEARRFSNVSLWSRGVDTDIFMPGDKDYLNLPRPIWVYAGRVAVEKNLDAFFELDLPGTKLVIGDGPAAQHFRSRYTDVVFAGYRFGTELAMHLAAADVFVFPSLTDTFGIVMLEAMACGLPVAAFPVTGPRDVVRNGVTGVLDDDLRSAALAALKLAPEDCIEQAHEFTWERATLQFFGNLTPADKQLNRATETAA